MRRGHSSTLPSPGTPAPPASPPTNAEASFEEADSLSGILPAHRPGMLGVRLWDLFPLLPPSGSCGHSHWLHPTGSHRAQECAEVTMLAALRARSKVEAETGPREASGGESSLRQLTRRKGNFPRTLQQGPWQRPPHPAETSAWGKGSGLGGRHGLARGHGG